MSDLDSTAARRRRAMLDAAEQLARRGGPDGVAMKSVAERAGVAIATLYRHFPSKTQLFIALYHDRNERLRDRAGAGDFPGTSPGDRILRVLLLEFRGMQRHHRLAEAMLTAINVTDRSASAALSETRRLRESVMIAAATGGGSELPHAQLLALRTVLATWGNEATSWMAGLRSADEVEEQLAFACRFIDLVEREPRLDDRRDTLTSLV